MRPDELATPEQLDMFHHPERFADTSRRKSTKADATPRKPAQACAATRERLGRLVDANPPRVTLTADVLNPNG